MSLEFAKKRLELSKVRTAREELEFRVLEKTDEIERLKGHITIQIEAEDRLESELNKLKGV